MSRGDAARFAAKWELDPATGCHVWIGYRSREGYGRFRYDGRTQYAHRFAYRLRHGRDPEGDTDHLCRNRACVNADHLEDVPRAENASRGAMSLDFDGLCKRGLHDVRAAGAIIRNGSGKRTCAECRRASARAQTERRRAARRAT